MLCSLQGGNICQYVLPFDGTPCGPEEVSCKEQQIWFISGGGGGDDGDGGDGIIVFKISLKHIFKKDGKPKKFN